MDLKHEELANLAEEAEKNAAMVEKARRDVERLEGELAELASASSSTEANARAKTQAHQLHGEIADLRVQVT